MGKMTDAETASALFDELQRVREENERLRKVAWAALIELNTIRARDGVPYGRQGYKSDVTEEYFSSIVDALFAVLDDDGKPWPAKRWLDSDGRFTLPQGTHNQ